MAARMSEGVAVGFALFVCFVGVLARFHIFTRANWTAAMVAHPPDKFKLRADPEAFLHMATHLFITMIATGVIVTLAFSGMDYDNTPHMKTYGMNYLLAFLEFPPASYVAPPYWSGITFCILRYIVLDTERLLYGTTSMWCKYSSMATNGIFGIVAIIFNMIWIVNMNGDVVTHELPFLMLVMCIPLAYIMHVWEMSFTRRPACLAIVILSIFTHVAVFYALGLVALRYNNMSPEYVKPLEWMWVGFCAVCPPATSFRSFRSCCGGGEAPTLTPVREIQVRPAPIEPRDEEGGMSAVSAEAPVLIQETPSFTTASTALTPESQELAVSKDSEAQQASVCVAGECLAAMSNDEYALAMKEARENFEAVCTKKPTPWEKNLRNVATTEAPPASAALAEARLVCDSRLPSEVPSALVTTLRSQGGAAGLRGTWQSQVQVEAGNLAEERSPAEAAEAITQEVIISAVKEDAAAEAKTEDKPGNPFSGEV